MHQNSPGKEAAIQIHSHFVGKTCSMQTPGFAASCLRFSQADSSCPCRHLCYPTRFFPLVLLPSLPFSSLSKYSNLGAATTWR